MKGSTLVMLIGMSISIVVPSSISRNPAYADDNGIISMSWLKDNAKLWVAGKMTDKQYVDSIRLFVQNDILSSTVPVQGNLTVSQSSSNVVPELTVPHSKNCNDQNFPRVDWSGCDHSNAYLSHANLNNANLQRTNLS
ncbi:MAG: pentapeptide repeat-containing protein, partial [Nitrosotalea sp.]